MKILKKNQIIIYTIVLMLMIVGYLNYTKDTQNQLSVETAIQTESKDDMKVADIGDATLVSSNDVEKGNDTNEKETNNGENKKIQNEINNNITESKQDTMETSVNSNDNYFAKSKLERDSMYSQMVENYEKILNSENSSEEQKQIATQEIKKISEIKNSIMICENLIITKGFENSVIFANNNSISIIIKAKELDKEQVAQIQNIISREMKTEPKDIHISTK